MLPRDTDDAGQEATGNRLLGRANAAVDVTDGHTPLSLKLWAGTDYGSTSLPYAVIVLRMCPQRQAKPGD